MADNVIIPAQGTGATTPNIATDDVGGIQHQRVKVEWGSDGVATDTSAANPLPVVQTGTPALPTGAATEATLAASNVLEGAVTETAPATDTASSGLNGRLQRIAQRLTSLIALLPASLGQKTMANGLAITIASDQSAVPVSGTVTTTPPSNASSNVAQINGVTPLMGTGNTGTGSLRVTLATDQTQLTNALKVDGSAVTQPVSQANPVQAATATLANVAGSASSVTLQASNGARKGLVVVNDSTAILYVKFGSSASTTSFSYFLAGSVGGVPATLELPAVVYTGIVTGIWASAVGSARMTELT